MGLFKKPSVSAAGPPPEKDATKVAAQQQAARSKSFTAILAQKKRLDSQLRAPTGNVGQRL